MSVYRSHRTGQAIADARAALDGHSLDPDTERCRECGSGAPCRPANHAANLLAEVGALEPAPATSRPLLTYGWRLTFGLTRRPAVPEPADERAMIEGEWR